MNRLFLKLGWVILAILCALPASAQTKLRFSVAAFEQDVTDLSAQSTQYKKTDGSGSLYAIVKVTSNNPDDDLREYKFNFGSLKHIVEEHDGELWLYVQKNAKTVTITRNGYAPIHRYDLRTTIQPGKNYVMQLSVAQRAVYKQMVKFAVTPPDCKAVVMIKSAKEGAAEEMFGIADSSTGEVAKSLEFGSYTYRIFAENYHESNGRIILDDRNALLTEKIALKPNFASVTLSVDSDADIYVNNELKGTRTWSGILKSGNYQVECRQKNHKPSMQYITVEDNVNKTYTLTPPTPILGTLAVTSTPLGAKIEVDGKNYGVTPRNIDIIIGSHAVTLSRQNYKTETVNVEVRENETADIDVKLSDFANITINSNPKGASLSINGQNVGTTPYQKEMASGEYILRLTAPKCRTYEKRVHLDSSNPTVDIKLDRQYQQRNAVYLQVGGQFGTLMGIGGAAGFYVGNVNVEAGFTMGMTSEKIYVNFADGKDPSLEELKPMCFGGRVGYGIIIGTRMRLTPQVGASVVSVKDNEIATYALCATVGLRFEYALAANFGISATGEGCFAVSKKDSFKQLEGISSKVKGWATGGNLRIGAYVNF